MVQPKSPQPSVQQRGEDTRRRLIEAGIEVFGSSGFEAASTRHIADKAGVNLAAIPYYFGSKEGLYRAVAEYIAGDDEPAASTARRIEALLKEIQPSREEALALLQELLDTLAITVIASDGKDHYNRFIMREFLDPSSAFDILYENFMQRILRPSTILIARLTDKTENDPECAVRAFALIGQILVFRTARAAVSKRLDWQDFTQERVDTIRLVIRQHIESYF